MDEQGLKGRTRGKARRLWTGGPGNLRSPEASPPPMGLLAFPLFLLRRLGDANNHFL